MPPFNQRKRFVQLLLRKDDMRAMKNSYLLPLGFMLCCVFLFVIFKNPFAVYEVRLLSWIASTGIMASFILAFKLVKVDQRRRKAEAKLKSSDIKFDKLYNSGMIGLWLTSLDGEIVQANDVFLDMIGYTRTELEAGAVNWKNITAPDYSELNQERLTILKETGWCPPCEKQYVRKDGSRINVMVASALLSNDPKAGIMAYALDITVTKEAEERIRQQQEEMMRIFMEAPAYIVIRKGPELKVTFVNNAALAQNKLGRANIEGASTADYFKKAGTNFNLNILNEVYKTGQPFKQNAYHVQYDRNGDGQPIDAWYDIVMEPTHDAAGNIDGVVTYTFDVSDFVRANDELQASETRFRFIADAIPHKMWTSGADGTATYYNQGWYDYSGTESFEELREKVWSMIHPDDMENTRKLWTNAVEKGEDVEIEQRLRQHDGQYLWHLSRVCVHKDDSGKLKMWVGTSTNIHAQKIAQEKIAASENHFRTLANSNTLLIWQTDENGETIFVNDTWRAYTGITERNTSLEDWVNNIHPEDREAAISDFRSANESKQAYQSKYRFKDMRVNNYRWMLDQARPVFNPEFSGYIGAMTDIHEQELAKIALEELARKKDDFFTIASHELKTPITTMKASMQVLQRMAEQGSGLTQAMPFIAKANKQAIKLTGIVNDLLDINKIQFGKLELNNSMYEFNESLQECIDEIKIQYPEVDILVKDELKLVVWADRVRIEQVILNLFTNALKYSPKGQPITVALEKEDFQFKCSITDNGIGIPPEKQPYIFDRFFRVHENSQHYAGLGMGLYICAEIIKQHRGAIGVISEEGQGSIFWFTLPDFIKVV
jgi:PAS domain S-box-containing protein